MKILLQNKNIVLTNNSLISINSDNIAENGSLIRVITPEAPKMSIIKNLSSATIALITVGGIVPKGNPDKIPSSKATFYKKYSIDGIQDLTSENYEVADGAYDPTNVNENPDHMLPVDIMRRLEMEGAIGRLYDYFYTTVGNGMAVDIAKTLGTNLANELKNENIDGFILTCADGIGTRAGALICKQLENILLKPVALVSAVSPVAMNAGATRVIPGVGIPNPLGNPSLDATAELALRREKIEKCLTALTTEVSKPTVFE